MAEPLNAWMPRETWDALVRGEGCPLCGAITATHSADEFGFTIADLEISRLRLVTNQYVQGYCVLICHKHVREPYELAANEQALFFEDMMRAGKVLEQVFAATKMNFQILGNAVPHLHAHILPRYYGDDAPGRPIVPDAHTVLLAPEAYEARVRRIRDALGELACRGGQIVHVHDLPTSATPAPICRIVHQQHSPA